jgi:hypothetical protein
MSGTASRWANSYRVVREGLPEEVTFELDLNEPGPAARQWGWWQSCWPERLQIHTAKLEAGGWAGSLAPCNCIPRKEEARKALSAVLFIKAMALTPGSARGSQDPSTFSRLGRRL